MRTLQNTRTNAHIREYAHARCKKHEFARPWLLDSAHTTCGALWEGAESRFTRFAVRKTHAFAVQLHTRVQYAHLCAHAPRILRRKSPSIIAHKCTVCVCVCSPTTRSQLHRTATRVHRDFRKRTLSADGDVMMSRDAASSPRGRERIFMVGHSGFSTRVCVCACVFWVFAPRVMRTRALWLYYFDAIFTRNFPTRPIAMRVRFFGVSSMCWCVSVFMLHNCNKLAIFADRVNCLRPDEWNVYPIGIGVKIE